MHLFIVNLLFLCPVNVAFLNKISLKSQSCVCVVSNLLSKTFKLVLSIFNLRLMSFHLSLLITQIVSEILI